MFMGLCLGVTGCALPFVVSPIRRRMGRDTFIWSDKGYPVEKTGYVISNQKLD